MRYFLRKQIHSTCASASTDDLWITKEVTADEFSGENVTVSEKYGVAWAYTDADRTFDSNSRGFLAHTPLPELQTHFERLYAADGWQIEHPFLQEAQRKVWADKANAELARRIAEGYVIPKWAADLPPESYQGGFSNEVFQQAHLQSYLQDGGAFGYIGHSVRKPELDSLLERLFLTVHPRLDHLAIWLTGTAGRHFGDNLEGHAFNEQCWIITQNLRNIVETAQQYAADEE